jgi:hypothetical protein
MRNSFHSSSTLARQDVESIDSPFCLLSKGSLVRVPPGSPKLFRINLALLDIPPGSQTSTSRAPEPAENLLVATFICISKKI